MTTRIVVPPVDYPVTIEEVKAAMRADPAEVTDQDILFEVWVAAETEKIEHELGRALMRQTRELKLDFFPDDIELSGLPVLAVESVSYINEDGIEQQVDALDYSPDDYADPEAHRFWIKRAVDVDWPETLDDAVDVVRVRYRCGYSDEDDIATQRAAIPQSIRAEIIARVVLRDALRTPIAMGAASSIAELPRYLSGANLDRYRVVNVG